MEFVVKLDRFEGPYTKLLDLITEKKLSITEISLASIADDYISYVQSLGDKSSVDISQFIVVASTLMLMKAKSLLPGVVYTEEEEKQVHDLEAKLEMYAILSRGMVHIKSVYGVTPLYARPRIMYKGGSVFVPDENLTPVTLQSIAVLTLASYKPREKLMTLTVSSVVRIETIIESLVERVQKASGVAFSSLADGAASFEEKKKLLIVNFIALLELIRSGRLHAEQGEDGGDITIAHS